MDIVTDCKVTLNTQQCESEHPEMLKFIFGPWENECTDDLLRRVVVLGFRLEAVMTECADRGIKEQFDEAVTRGREYFDKLRYNLASEEIIMPDGEVISTVINDLRMKA